MTKFILEYWIEFLFGLGSTAIMFYIKKIGKKVNEQEAIKLGVQALLRDRIIQAYNIYYDRGSCPIYARENIQELSKQYTNLGGNGVICDLLKKLQSLPTSKEGEHYET